MRILNLKELELVAGASNYNYPVLTDEELATMTPEQIDFWSENEHRKWLDWLYSNNDGDRQPDYDWMEKHGNTPW